MGFENTTKVIVTPGKQTNKLYCVTFIIIAGVHLYAFVELVTFVLFLRNKLNGH